ncbi:MAG: tetratricopeptide repeat protein [Alphaproteobacteria bacterium]|nr:MAG: tetratricopeptide repeat protein [Alphaproteobacteria bacterium]
MRKLKNHSRSWARAGVVALSLALSACATSTPGPTGSAGVVAPRGTPSHVFLAGVPLIEQKDDYCGPASLAMALAWVGPKVSQDEVADQVFSPGAQGAYRADLMGSARRHGQLAVTLSVPSDLYREVGAGNPVIVFQNLGLDAVPVWHYSVVVGFDLVDRFVLVHSGKAEMEKIETAAFERTWARGDYWGMVVVSPGVLPASADRDEVLHGAAALESLGNYEAATMVYQAGRQRWPDSWMWSFGEGNVAYAQGDLMGAITAYEAALDIDPTIPEVKQNLDEVFKELTAKVSKS